MSITYNQAVEQTIAAGEQIHQIVNGTATTEVTVEDGSKVPSIRKALLDNFYFKDPIAWQVGQTENVFNQLRQFTDGSWWYAPSATASNPISMGSTPVGDSLWKIYDFDAIGKLTPQLREALRRSYAEAGYNLVAGSFEAGGTLVNANDVLLQERTGKAFSGPAGTVAAGTNPASGGFVDKSGVATSASAISNANGGSVQDFIDAQYTTVTELATGKFQVGQYVRLTDRAMGLFLLKSGGTANGYDIIDAGNGNTAIMVDDIAVRSNSLSWGFEPSDILPTINQTSTLNAMISDAKAKKYKMFVAAGNYLVDKINLVDFNVGGFVGAGMEKTTFWQAIDLIDEPFLNCGTEGDYFSPTDSDVQFAEIGGFTIRSNNKVTWRGTSWNFFRRGKVFSIRAVGYLTGHYYNYSWLDNFSGMYSEDHTSTGHHFGGASLNAINAEGFVSSSSNPFVRDYNYDNPNTLLLSCMDSEGSGNGHYFNDGRSVTLLNSHHEGVNTRMRTTTTSVNGLCVNIVGGASFNAPNYFAMPNSTLALTVTNFTLYDVGADFSGVVWAINAKTVVINNLKVVDSNKNKATRRQIRTWLINSLGLNVDFCSLDGEILRMNGVNAFHDETDKYFNVTPTPGTPVDIPTFSDLNRSQITITLVQRLSSTQIASVIINAVITDAGVISQSEVSQINNGTANMVLGYNATTNKLTLDSTFAVTTKVIIERVRA